jgi:hypothetical protein
MNVQRSPRRDARKSVEQDRVVVGYSPDGMPLNAAGEIVLTPMMRLEGCYMMDNGSVGKRSRLARQGRLM